jgi:ABC-2 type transport system ATP-binding protein
LFDEIMPADDLVVLHQGHLLAHGSVGNIVANAGAHDINSAFKRLTGASAGSGSAPP